MSARMRYATSYCSARGVAQLVERASSWRHVVKSCFVFVETECRDRRRWMPGCAMCREDESEKGEGRKVIVVEVLTI